MTWLVRAIITLVAGWLCMQLGRAFVGLPSSPAAADFQFSGLLILGGNVLFSVLDFYFTQFNQRTEQLAGVAHAPAKLARQLRQQTQRARRHISLVVTAATVLKGSGAMCGLLITQRALAPTHYFIARDLGFFTLGAGLPTVIILWRSVRKAEAVLEETTCLLEESRDRRADLEAIRLNREER
jgi:hypothetical protein